MVLFEHMFFFLMNCKCLQKSIIISNSPGPFIKMLLQSNGGGEHPAVEDFLRASLRELRKVEKAAEQARDDGVDLSNGQS